MIAFVLSLIVRLLILCVFAYCIIVLIEHGTSGFLAGLTTEWKPLMEFFRGIPALIASGR